MGEVYLAEDTTLRRLVAIKLLPAEFTADPDRLHRFERRGRLDLDDADDVVVERSDVGVADVVVLPAKAVIVVVRGMAWVGASVITVTLALN